MMFKVCRNDLERMMKLDRTEHLEQIKFKGEERV